MSERSEIDPAVKAMLKEHLGDVEVPAAARLRLESSFGIGGGGSGSSGSGPSAKDAVSKSNSPLPSPRAGSLGKAALLVTLGALVGGSASELHHALSPSPQHDHIIEKTVYVDREVLTEQPIEKRDEAKSSGAQNVEGESSSRKIPPSPASSSVEQGRDGDASLRRERVLIEAARSALARGDAPAALARLDEHARQFQSGQLAESREALRVQVLALTGDADEAERRAKAFKKAYPRSLFGPVVEDAVTKGDAGRAP